MRWKRMLLSVYISAIFMFTIYFAHLAYRDDNALLRDLFILGDNDNDDKQIGEEKPKELKICAQCGEKIEGKFLLRALDQFWHEECLKCSYCSTQLADLSSKFYHKGDLILCKRDYIRWDFLLLIKIKKCFLIRQMKVKIRWLARIQIWNFTSFLSVPFFTVIGFQGIMKTPQELFNKITQHGLEKGGRMFR